MPGPASGPSTGAHRRLERRSPGRDSQNQLLAMEPYVTVRAYVVMRRIIHAAFGGVVVALAFSAVAAARTTPEARADRPSPVLTSEDGAPVELESLPGSLADGIARQLMASDIASAKKRGENPLVLVGMGWLNDREEMLFVQLQSPSECGSAGCSTASFKNVNGRWVKTIDTVGGPLRVSTNPATGVSEVVVTSDTRISAK